MKHKSKGKKEVPIREIDVGSIIEELSRPSGPAAPSTPTKGPNPHVDSKKETSKQTLSKPNNGNVQAPAPSSHTGPRPADPSVTPVRPDFQINGGPESGEPMSRSQKQRMRLKKRLLARQPHADGADSGSDTSQAAPEPPAAPEQIQKNPRPRKNYVERSSAATAIAVSSCGWKDATCIFFVLLAMLAAGLMRFQEEVFGSLDHVRMESDADADFYEILGITHAATARDIKRAYRNKVIEVHPDQHPDCADCGQKFIATTKAYETLSDDEKRKVYDQTRGSYEPILSDFSVSLTSFNYEQLVTKSASVWIVQVYDDLDASSKHFATQWDSVANSDLGQVVKFGRVNARRDRALLSSLPMRARTFPAVMMFSRDTMPSIFSIADVSAKALRRWVIAELPSHIDESTSTNAFVVEVAGRAPTPSAFVKIASVEFARVFDIHYAQDLKMQKSELTVTIKSKDSVTNVVPAIRVAESTLIDELTNVMRRIPISLNRHNFHDLCASGDVVCIVRPGSLLPKPILMEETALQPVSSSALKTGTVIDAQASRIAIYHHNSLDDLHLDDLQFSAVDMTEFVNAKFPRGIFGTMKEHATVLTVAALAVLTFLAVSKVGPVQITVAVAVMSVLVGVLNAIPAGSFAALLKLVRH